MRRRGDHESQHLLHIDSIAEMIQFQRKQAYEVSAACQDTTTRLNEHTVKPSAYAKQTSARGPQEVES